MDSSALQRLLLNHITHSNNPFCVVGEDARILFVNDALCESLGYAREELMGQLFWGD